MPGSSRRVLGRGRASWLVSSATLRFALRITRRGVLSFPFPLLFLCKEPHLGWFSLDAPAVFRHPHVPIRLHLVQGLLLEFAVPDFKADGIPLLRALEGATETGIEPRPMILENHELFVDARRIELRIFGPLEAFQATYGLVNASIHQQNCFVQMRLLHLNLLHCLRRKAALRQSTEVLGHSDSATVGRPTRLDNENGESAREEFS